MRVLIFSTDDFLYPAGGAEAAIEEITRRLPQMQFDLICARLRKTASKKETLGNVTIYRIGFGMPKLDALLLALWGPRLAAKLHRQNTYALIWAMLASWGAAAAARTKKKLELPFVLGLQEGDDMAKFERKLKFLFLYSGNFFAQADALASISRYLDRWGVRMGYKGDRHLVIPNGVDTEAFARIERTASTPGNTVVITTSRLVEKNGVEDIIRALPSLPSSVSLRIAGDGPLGARLKELARTLGIQDRVTFFGYVRREEVPGLLAVADIFCRPSLSEGLGNSFLEAFAARLPVIATPVGGIPDFLIDGETGFFCEPHNPMSIAKAVTRIQNLSAEQKEAVLKAASELVDGKYNWNTVAKQTGELFESLAI